MGDKTFELLKSIKNHPCIYNFNLPDYSQREITIKAWNEVAKENNSTVTECKEKWKNLRYGFLRSMKPNPDGSVKRKYYLHDFMEFVLPYLMPKQSDLTTMMSVECDTDEENNGENNDEITNVKTEVNNEEQMENEDTQELFDFNMLLNANQSGLLKPTIPQPKVIDDSRRMFLLSLLPEINILTESQMRVFRRKVFTLIDEIVDTSNLCMTKKNNTQSQSTNISTSLYETQAGLIINNHEIKMERL